VTATARIPDGLAQMGLLSRRVLRRTLRTPASTLPNGILAVFMLIAYNGLLGDSPQVQSVTGGNYVNFVLPVALLSGALSAANAGLLLVGDLDDGYLDRLLTQPLSRRAMLAAPVLVAAAQVTIQSIVIVVVGIAIGGDPQEGLPGVLVVIGLTLVWAIGFAAYSIAVGLRTGNPEGTLAACFLLFPLVFLGPAFLPTDQLQDWVQVVADVNPAAYLMEAMRSPLVDGWDWGTLWPGLLAGALFAAAMWALALREVNRVVRAR
jgi:ABC-2 type transport system permease protein